MLKSSGRPFQKRLSSRNDEINKTCLFSTRVTSTFEERGFEGDLLLLVNTEQVIDKLGYSQKQIRLANVICLNEIIEKG